MSRNGLYKVSFWLTVVWIVMATASVITAIVATPKDASLSLALDISTWFGIGAIILGIATLILMYKNHKQPVRGFEKLYETAIEPTRGTEKSAGYDLHAYTSVTIKAGETGLIKTGVTAYMQADEVLILKSRSGLSYKKGVIVGAGVIDADYNPGEIGVVIHNWTSEDLHFEAGDKVAQGIFVSYLVADGDQAGGKRNGGFGSTDK